MNDIEEIKYTKRDDNVYMFRVPKSITEAQAVRLREMLKESLPKGSMALCLTDGYDYIPPDNEALAKRLDDIECSIQELINLFDSRTR